jgi:hypothetical protein
MALLFTYDEAGGFFDHVPPPNQACIARSGATDAPYYELGVRIPMVVVSPYARPNYVSHVVQEHTALTRLIEAVFDLPALTARDANSDALLDLFDFSGAPPLLQPPAAPAAGTKGCFGSIVLTTDKPNYAVGDPIHISFTGAPGNNGKDWIAVYTYPAAGATPPEPGSLAFQYIDGTHTPGASPAMGTITIDASSVSMATWPLPSGEYIAYYLLNGGLVQASSIDFHVQ